MAPTLALCASVLVLAVPGSHASTNFHACSAVERGTAAEAFLIRTSGWSRRPRRRPSARGSLSGVTVARSAASAAEVPTDDVPPPLFRQSGAPPSAFNALGWSIARALVKSDLRRNECNDGASTGWTAWVDEEAAAELRKSLSEVCLASSRFEIDYGSESSVVLDVENSQRAEWLRRRDNVRLWTAWMRSIPAPMSVDLSEELRAVVDSAVSEEDLKAIDSTREDLLLRCGCTLYLLPSGSSLPTPLRTPPGAMAYGRLLYGGCKRFRLLPGGKYGSRRKAGERTVVASSVGKENLEENVWLQYGGPERNYEAVDIGPCAVVETTVLPRGLSLLPGPCDDVNGNDFPETMVISGLGWKPEEMFEIVKDDDSCKDVVGGTQGGSSQPLRDSALMSSEFEANERNNVIRGSLSSAVGGLQHQIDSIVRRVLDGRSVQPALQELTNGTNSDDNLGYMSENMEAAELEALGLSPVRGLLLYGPPGCGKTALAREISKALRAHPPIIVAAPELLDRWVGGSEFLVRSMFAEAEAELKACGGDASKSALHVVVIDEIDAVFRKRSASSDSGEATRASCVNQILSKLDGVDAIPNVLVIGMTNRRELLDEALLRPGRLEVQVEIPLPDQTGRREILQIHFDSLRRCGCLSQPLCRAIDGEVNLNFKQFNRKVMNKAMNYAKRSMPFSKAKIVDLSEESVTGGFSGADLAGLVRCAGSIALSRSRQKGDGVDGLLITLNDVADALEEIKR